MKDKRHIAQNVKDARSSVRIAHPLGFILLIATVLGLTTSCGKQEFASVPTPGSVSAPKPKIELGGVLVEAPWLLDHLSAVDLVIVDARDAKAYAEGHIAGAINLSPGALLDPDPANSKNMAPISLVEKTLRGSGIEASSTAIIYDDDDESKLAARIFWVMEVHGHRSVAVMNGGMSAWTRNGHTTSIEPNELSPKKYVAAMRPERLATQLAVMRAVRDGGATILDSRSREEYEGMVSRASRKGHIQGAINVDAQHNLVVDADGVCTINYSEDLMDLYPAEIKEGQKVITYCNSGNRASVSYLALRVVGHDVAVYDGSWLEWGNDLSLPIESPSAEPDGV